MATFDTSVYTAQKSDRTNTSRNAAPNLVSNDIQFATVSITTTTGYATNDIIRLCVLPAGSIPVPQLSFVTTDIAVDSLTIDVGTAANTDGWADGVVLGAAVGNLQFCAAGITQPAWVAETPLVADTGSGNAIVYATVMADSTPAAATLTFVLAYKRGR
jgi:hypothetical protein